MLRQRVIDFWRYSERLISHFDFQGFFDEYSSILTQKLALHGLLTFEDYLNHIQNIYPLNELCVFVHTTHDGVVFGLNDMLQAIFKPRFDYYRALHKDNPRYITLISLWRELGKAGNLNHSAQVMLVDRCIHAEHNSGGFINIEGLRREYERVRVG